MSHHPKPWQSGDHLVICDSCGAQRYRSQCDFTWDGFLMCHIRKCWYPREPIFDIPPVINDPYPIQDVRPDQTVGQETYIDDTVGMVTTFDNAHFLFNSNAKRFGQVDEPPNYIGS